MEEKINNPSETKIKIVNNETKEDLEEKGEEGEEEKEEKEEKELMTIADELEDCTLCGNPGAYIKEEGVFICKKYLNYI